MNEDNFSKLSLRIIIKYRILEFQISTLIKIQFVIYFNVES